MQYRLLFLITLVAAVVVTGLYLYRPENTDTKSAITLNKRDSSTYEMVSSEGAFVLGEVSGWELDIALTIKAEGASGRTFKYKAGERYQFAFEAEGGVPHTLVLSSAAGDLGKANLKIDTILPVATVVSRNKAAHGDIKSPRLQKLAKAVSGNPAAENNFWAEIKKSGSPLIEPQDDNTALYSFLWRGRDTTSVEISWAVWTEDRSENQFNNIPGTDVWFKTVELPLDAAMSYKLIPNIAHLQGHDRGLYRRVMDAVTQKDPLNPRYWNGEGLHSGASLLLGPDAPGLAWSVEREGVAKGSVEQTVFHSGILGNKRSVALYRPAVSSDEPLPVVMIYDGGMYLEEGGAGHLLDNLIAEGHIPPVAAVFVYNTVPSTRGEELPCNPAFADFMADELLPFVQQAIPETGGAKTIITAGSSFGGLASACVNYFRPEVFTHVLSMSGAYWWRPQETSNLFDKDEAGWLLRATQEKGCRANAYYFDAGALETGYGMDSIADSSKAFSEQVSAQGCHSIYRTFPGGHDRYHWRETLGHGLAWLLSGKELWVGTSHGAGE